MAHKHVERSFVLLHVGKIQTLVATWAPPKQNEVQMTFIFHLLQFKRHMSKYPPMKELWQFAGYLRSTSFICFPFLCNINLVSNDTSLYVHVPLKHWMEGLGWEMAESLFNMVRASWDPESSKCNPLFLYHLQYSYDTRQPILDQYTCLYNC